MLKFTFSSQEDREIPLKESWIRAMGGDRACIYGLCAFLSMYKGYCYMCDKNLSEKLCMSPSKIQRHLCWLEKNGWIFRNSFSKLGRTRRQIVIRENAKRYWDEFLDRDCIKEKIKVRFLEQFYQEEKEESSLNKIGNALLLCNNRAKE